MLESMNKKTIVIIGSSIIGLIVFLLIVVWLISIIKPHYYTYEEFETKVSEAAKSYYKNNPTALPSTDGEYNMSYNTLVEGEYVKPLNEMLKDGDNCTVQILVTKYSDNYSYIPYLNCPGSYETKELYKVISENNPVVEKGSGLYSNGNGEYYFRGEITNNYVQLGTYGESKKDQKPYLWQILGIESDGSVKIRSTVGTTKRYAWDDRYNEEKHSSYGYNDFELSRLKETLISLASGNEILSDTYKNKLVAKELCIGKRKADDTTKDGSTECSIKSESKYLFGALTPYEVMRISLDDNCKVANSLSCSNYNFLSTKLNSVEWSITGLDGTTDSSFYIKNGSLTASKNNTQRKLYVVAYINKRTFYKSGTGTSADQYIIR